MRLAKFKLSIVLIFLSVVIVSCSESEKKTIKKVDYKDASRYTKVTLYSGLNEPTEFVILPDKKVIVVERKGDIKLFDEGSRTIKLIGHIPVYSEQEDGLMGIALDPNFDYNGWIYLYYSPEGPEEKQHLSRFQFNGDQVDMSSEIIVLEVATQRQECCHTGGSIEFGPDGLLYLSTGDDTNPFGSEGFAPIDEGSGRSPWDAQKSSGNTNDLRGKILRISMNSDGTYKIPEGNLFPLGTAGTRPEIYVMGCRNPYRISIDQKNNWLFWGEVGPDAGETTSNRGPRGHDEINLAKQAGNFGWPYFVGDNKAYRDYNFQSKQSADAFLASSPKNLSPNNTGLVDLPPAQKALIWYPYAESDEFPMLGKGGRNAMAGPIYYSSDFKLEPNSLPAIYDGKLFIYDWIRGWIFTVTINDEGKLGKIEPFMPDVKFNYMIDMQMGPEGALYILEYGTGWFTKNDDSSITRIDFNGGNRTPVLQAKASKHQGAAPLEVEFSSDGTYDYDGEKLFYTWEIDGQKIKEANTNYTFEKPGIYYPKLIVKDQSGGTISRQLTIEVGNEPPELEIVLSGNNTFYFPGRERKYEVKLTDKEDGSLGNGIEDYEVDFRIDYLAEGLDLAKSAQGHQIVSKGQRLIGENDCQSCHKLNEKSIGPSYEAVANKYGEKKDAIAYLSSKIIAGGAGVWGEQAMSAHPDLAPSEAEEIVKYILSVGKATNVYKRPLKGDYTFANGKKNNFDGTYIFSSVYEDNGGDNISPIKKNHRIILRNPLVQAELFDEGKQVVIFDFKDEKKFVRDIYHDSYIIFKSYDLTEIDQLILGFLDTPSSQLEKAFIELHEDSPNGKLIGKVNLSESYYSHYKAMKVDYEGKTDLCFVFKSPEAVKEIFPPLDWIYFDKESISNTYIKTL